MPGAFPSELEHLHYFYDKLPEIITLVKGKGLLSFTGPVTVARDRPGNVYGGDGPLPRGNLEAGERVEEWTWQTA